MRQMNGTSLSRHFLRLLRNSIATNDLDIGRALHALYLKSIVPNSTSLSNLLIHLYSKCGQLSFACQMFDEIPQPNIYSYNTLLSAYTHTFRTEIACRFFLQIPNPDLVSYNTLLCMHATKGNVPEVFRLFMRMWESGVGMDGVTLSSVVSVVTCGVEQIHAFILSCGFDSFVSVANAMIGSYSRCGCLADARKMFDEMNDTRDEVSWNCMIMAYGKHGKGREALSLFREMVRRGSEIDVFTLASVLMAFTTLGDLTGGKQFHAQLIKTMRQRNAHVGTGLVELYSKSGRICDAEKVFDEVNNPDLILWNALMSCYTFSDRFCEKALDCFRRMQQATVRPDGCSLVSALTACSKMPSSFQGKQVHSLMLKLEFLGNYPPSVNNALVAMYSRFGDIGEAKQVFERMAQHDIISFNSMIAGYAQHGMGAEALDLFRKMLKCDIVVPTSITFISVLSACAHTGRVKEGWEYFNSMQQRFGITPDEKHYTCMIDLLGRAGEFEEVVELIKSMPFDPGTFGWTALLSACRTHGNFELGVKAASHFIELEPLNAAAYVTLSNMYAKMGRWSEATRIRRLMEGKGAQKEVGYSRTQGEEDVHLVCDDHIFA